MLDGTGYPAKELNRHSSSASLVDHPDDASAVPTPDHFLPLLYTAGLAARSGTARALVRAMR